LLKLAILTPYFEEDVHFTEGFREHLVDRTRLDVISSDDYFRDLIDRAASFVSTEFPSDPKHHTNDSLQLFKEFFNTCSESVTLTLVEILMLPFSAIDISNKILDLLLGAQQLYPIVQHVAAQPLVSISEPPVALMSIGGTAAHPGVTGGVGVGASSMAMGLGMSMSGLGGIGDQSADPAASLMDDLNDLTDPAQDDSMLLLFGGGGAGASLGSSADNSVNLEAELLGSHAAIGGASAVPLGTSASSVSTSSASSGSQSSASSYTQFLLASTSSAPPTYGQISTAALLLAHLPKSFHAPIYQRAIAHLQHSPLLAPAPITINRDTDASTMESSAESTDGINLSEVGAGPFSSFAFTDYSSNVSSLLDNMVNRVLFLLHSFFHYGPLDAFRLYPAFLRNLLPPITAIKGSLHMLYLACRLIGPFIGRLSTNADLFAEVHKTA
jgi:hypothetical protein